MKYHTLLKEICDEKNIKMTLVSNNWVCILEKNNITRFIKGYRFSLNSASASDVIADKYALYDVLKHFNIPTITHHLLYKNYDKSEVIELFTKYNQNVVVKSNLGQGGDEVFHITDETELFSVMDKLFIKNSSISLCPYYEIKTEYRLVALKGKIELMYAKIKPEVIGDGKSTVQSLLEKFNNAYFKDKSVSSYVPKEGEKYTYNWQFNLSKGAISSLDIEKEKKEGLLKLANIVLKKIPVDFCTLDIIETEKEFLVLEMNAGVLLNAFMNQHEEGYKIAKDIYSKAIDYMF